MRIPRHYRPYRFSPPARSLFLALVASAIAGSFPAVSGEIWPAILRQEAPPGGQGSSVSLLLSPTYFSFFSRVYFTEMVRAADQSGILSGTFFDSLRIW